MKIFARALFCDDLKWIVRLSVSSIKRMCELFVSYFIARVDLASNLNLSFQENFGEKSLHTLQIVAMLFFGIVFYIF